MEISSINKLGCCTVEMPLRQYQRCFLRPYLLSSDWLFISMAAPLGFILGLNLKGKQ